MHKQALLQREQEQLFLYGARKKYITKKKKKSEKYNFCLKELLTLIKYQSIATTWKELKAGYLVKGTMKLLPSQGSHKITLK